MICSFFCWSTDVLEQWISLADGFLDIYLSKRVYTLNHRCSNQHLVLRAITGAVKTENCAFNSGRMIGRKSKIKIFLSKNNLVDYLH